MSEEYTVDILDGESEGIYEIEAEEAFAALGESNTQLSHALMTQREISDQHPITAITGLRSELDYIESFKTVQSDKRNFAQYHLWHDENPQHQNRVGYFVSLVNNTDHIQIGGLNVYGVTVSSSGFVGGQDATKSNAIMDRMELLDNWNYTSAEDIDYNTYKKMYFARYGVNTNDTSETYYSVTQNLIDVNEWRNAINPSVRDDTYGLVAIMGNVKVRRESNVEAGDCVIPNASGYATKSNAERYRTELLDNWTYTSATNINYDTYKKMYLARYGVETSTTSDYYYSTLQSTLNVTEWYASIENADWDKYGYVVTSIGNDSGTLYAMINLVPQTKALYDFKCDVVAMQERLKSDEYNINAAINAANAAQQYAQTNVGSLGSRVTAVEGTVGSAYSIAQTASSTAAQASSNSAIAQARAEAAAAAAIASQQEVVTVSNNAVSTINELKEKFDPIDTWVDPETGNTGAEYLINYIQNGVSTSVDIQTLESDIEEVQHSITRNAKGMQSLAHNLTKYSVGAYSQAYGLKKTDLSSILSSGIVYVPISTHNETYSDDNNPMVDIFTYGYSYTWNGDQWIESSAQNVSFSSTVPSYSAGLTYWYNTSTSDFSDNKYSKETLFKWYGDANGYWMPVATLENNTLSRTTSLIKQTSNELSASISNTNDNMASISAKVDSNESKIGLVVTNNNGTNKINAASIITAVNEDESSIEMSADRIKLNGGTIDMATNQFVVTAGNGFRLDQNGISWTTESNPTKMVYSQVLISKPINGRLYNSVAYTKNSFNSKPTWEQDKYYSYENNIYTLISSEPTNWNTNYNDYYTSNRFLDNSTVTWHKVESNNDKYASETTDNGLTWSQVRQIRGQDGESSYLFVRYSANSDGNPMFASPQTDTEYMGLAYTNVNSAPDSYSDYTWSKIKGNKGDSGDPGATIKTVRAYYLKNSSTPPSTISNGTSTLPSGWTSTPSGVTTNNLYEFVSECTVTNGNYGTWSTPVCYAHYGSDATVTKTNVFNALTNNGNNQLLVESGGNLYLNASYINTGTLTVSNNNDTILSVDADTGELIAKNGTIGNLHLASGALTMNVSSGSWYADGALWTYIGGLNSVYSDDSNREAFLFAGITYSKSYSDYTGNNDKEKKANLKTALCDAIDDTNWGTEKNGLFPDGSTNLKDYIKNNAKFYVGWDGKLKATDANITGDITANKLILEQRADAYVFPEDVRTVDISVNYHDAALRRSVGSNLPDRYDSNKYSDDILDVDRDGRVTATDGYLLQNARNGIYPNKHFIEITNSNIIGGIVENDKNKIQYRISGENSYFKEVEVDTLTCTSLKSSGAISCSQLNAVHGVNNQSDIINHSFIIFTCNSRVPLVNNGTTVLEMPLYTKGIYIGMGNEADGVLIAFPCGDAVTDGATTLFLAYWDNGSQKWLNYRTI